MARSGIDKTLSPGAVVTTGTALVLTTLAVGCGDTSSGRDDIGARLSPLRLEAACAESASSIDAGAWLCPDTRIVECVAAERDAVETVYVTPDGTCTEIDPVVDEGPYGPGTYEVVVTDGPAGDAGPPLCATTLQVVDTLAPTLESEDEEIVLWPPNHKMHEISADDCAMATDRCDPELDVQFSWATSDEPHEGRGDGNHAPDIELGCDTVRVRAERSGRGDGRVYELGFRAVDDAGNATDGVCRVVVPHDRASMAVGGAPVVTLQSPDACHMPDGVDGGSAPEGPSSGAGDAALHDGGADAAPEAGPP